MQLWHLLLKSDLYSMYTTLVKNACNALDFKPEQYFNFEWSLLEALGFTDEEIEAANDYVCGTMTVEGAPLPERLNTCRFLIVPTNAVKKASATFMHMAISV